MLKYFILAFQDLRMLYAIHKAYSQRNMRLVDSLCERLEERFSILDILYCDREEEVPNGER